MAGLLADFPCACARHSGAGGKTGAKGVTGVATRIEPGSFRALLDDDANSFARQALFGDVAVAIDATEDRTGLDLRMVQPFDKSC